MPTARHIAALAVGLLLAHAAAHATQPAKPKTYTFAAVGHTNGDDKQLAEAIKEADEAKAEFIVTTGVKAANEPCTDKLYTARRTLMNDSRRPLVLSLAASDWTGCRNSAGRSNAIERLNRLRELYFFDSATLGKDKLQVKRLSSSAKFRSYAENAHWEVDGVLYATVNIPSNNNHYLLAAGRNSEYEDRLVANRSWLRRLFTLARQRDMNALVLFTEADISAAADDQPLPNDGFAEVRKQLAALAKKYDGKVLLVDSAALAKNARPSIDWRGNLGHLSLGTSSVQVKVTPGKETRFALTSEPKR